MPTPKLSYKDFILNNIPEDFRQAYEEGTLDDEGLARLAVGLGLDERAPKDFSGVKSSVDSTATAKRKGLDNLEDMIQRDSDATTAATRGGFKSTFGSALYAAADEASGLVDPIREAFSKAGPAGQLLASGNPFVQAGDLAEEALPVASRARASGDVDRKEAEELLSTVSPGTYKTLMAGATDVAGSPSSLGSVPGGVFGAIPMADVYLQEYADAREAGLPREQARLSGAVQGGGESLALFPAGKFGAAILGKTGLGKAATAKVSSLYGGIAGKTALTGTGEAAEEGLTFAIQDKSRELMSRTGNKPLDDYQAARISTDYWGDFKRSTVAGFMGGTSIGGAATSYEQAARFGAEAAAVMNNVKLDARIGEVRREMVEEDRVKSDAIDVTEQARLPEADALRAAEQQRVADEAEAAFRNEEIIKQAQIESDYTGEQVQPQLVRGEDVRAERELKIQQEQDLQRQQAEQELSPYLATAEKDLKRADAKRLSNAKARHRAAARKNAEQLLEQAETMPVDEAKAFVAQGRLEWDKANPAPTAASVNTRAAPGATTATAPAQPVNTPAPQTATQAVVEPVVPAEPVAEQPLTAEEIQTEQDLRSQYAGGLDSKPEQGVTGPRKTAEQLAKDIIKKARTNKDSAVLMRMLANGNVSLVNTANDITTRPADSGSTQGYYDGERVWLVADKVDPNNIKGSVLSVLAHEGKHVGDLTDNKSIQGSFKNLLGEEANQRIIQKAEKEAASAPNSVSGRAVARAQKADKAVYDLEVPAYLVEEAAKARANNNPLSGAYRDLISSVRTKYRALTGNEDIDVSDMAYLSSKLLEQIALTPGSTKSSKLDGGVDSILPLRAVTTEAAKEAQSKERDYLDPVDGERKFVISDSEAELTDNGDKLRRAINSEASASQVLYHPELFKKIPDLRGVSIVALRGPEALTSLAVAYPELDTIAIQPAILARAAAGDPKTRERLRNIILHELQHITQFKGEGSSGGSPAVFFDKDQKQVIRLEHKASKDRNAAAQAYANELAQDGQPVPLIDGELDMPTLIEFALDAVENGNFASKHEENLIRGFVESNTDFEKAERAANAVYDATYDRYLQIQGEREAVWTENNSRKTLDELPVNPTAIPESEGGLPGTNAAAFVTTRDTKGNMTVAPSRVAGLNSFADDTRDQAEQVIGIITGDRLQQTIDLTKSLFSKFGPLGRALKNIVELSDSEASQIAYVAKGNYHRLGFGIDNLATDTMRPGETLATARARVGKKLDEVIEQMAAVEDHGRREALLARFVSNNPDMKPFQDAVNDINEQAERIIRSRMADPKPLSREEIAKYSAIRRNKFVYFNRTFAAFQGEAGKQWTRRMHDEWALAEAQIAKGKGVSKKYAESFRVYSKAIKFVMDNEVNISDPKVLAGKDMNNIERMYSMWVKDSEHLKREMENSGQYSNPHELARDRKAIMVTAISAAVEQASDYQINSKAEAVVKAMVNLTEGNDSTTRYLRGFKQDKSILMTKEHVPHELRELFGEITDWPTKVAITLAKQGELVARHKALNMIRQKHEGDLVIKESDRGSKPEFEKFTEHLGGDNWGPLEGMFTTPIIKKALTDVTTSFMSVTEAAAKSTLSADPLADKMGKGFVGTLIKVAGLQKLNSIVFSGFTVGANAAGSGLVIVQHGITNPEHSSRAIKAAILLVNNQINPRGTLGKRGPAQRDADLELFIKYGLLESATMEEIRRSPQHFVRELIKQTEGVTAYQDLQNILNKAKDKAGNGVEAWKEMFAMSDAWTRPAVFLDRAEFLTEVNKLENKGWSQDEIYRRAADYAKDTTITFTRAAPIARVFERIGWTTFMPYFQTVFNSLIHTSVYAVKDLIHAAQSTDPDVRALYTAQGGKKLVGVGLATGGGVMLTKMIAAVLNSDDEDEENEGWIEGAKKLLFHEGRFGDGIYLGKDLKGNPLFFRLSRLDPLGPATDLIRIALSNEGTAEERTKHIVSGFVDLYFANRAAGNLLDLGREVFYGGEGAVKDKKTKLERISPALTDWFKEKVEQAPMIDYNDAEVVMTFLDSFVPGFANALDKTNTIPVTDAGASDKILALMVTSIGGRLDKADPAAAARGAGWDLDNHRKEARKAISNTAETRGPEAGFQRYLDALEDEQNYFNRMQEVYDGMGEMGMSHRQIAEVMKDTPLDPTDLSLLRQRRTSATVQEWGTKWSRLLSEESLNKRGENRDRDLTDEEKKEREKERKEVIKRLNIMRKNI